MGDIAMVETELGNLRHICFLRTAWNAVWKVLHLPKPAIWAQSSFLHSWMESVCVYECECESVCVCVRVCVCHILYLFMCMFMRTNEILTFVLNYFFFFQDHSVYWIHRIYHWPWLYKHFHKLHHKYKQPTAFSVTAIHPVESLHIQLTLTLPLFIIPVHWCEY